MRFLYKVCWSFEKIATMLNHDMAVCVFRVRSVFLLPAQSCAFRAFPNPQFLLSPFSCQSYPRHSVWLILIRGMRWELGTAVGYVATRFQPFGM